MTRTQIEGSGTLKGERTPVEGRDEDLILDDIKETRVVLNLLVRGLVDEPDDVRVNVVRGAQSIIYEVSAHPDDMRRVIGRKGRTADAIRELLNGLGGRVRLRYLLEIIEPPNRT